MPSPAPTPGRRALLVLLGVTLVLPFLPDRLQGALKSSALGVLAPVLSPVRSTSRAGVRWLARRLDLGPEADLNRQLGDLQASLAQREEEAGSLRRQLAALAQIKERLPAVKPLPARVIGADAVRWRRSLVLDRGGEDGVLNGQAVVCGGRLLGMVVTPASSACRVQCLTDANSRVWVLIGHGNGVKPDGGRIQAVLKGDGTGRLLVLLCERPGDAQPGDLVVTAGYDGRYSAGLLVGTVDRVTGSGETAVVSVAPACDPDQVEEVQILLGGVAP